MSLFLMIGDERVEIGAVTDISTPGNDGTKRGPVEFSCNLAGDIPVPVPVPAQRARLEFENGASVEGMAAMSISSDPGEQLKASVIFTDWTVTPPARSPIEDLSPTIGPVN
jgi:hypothetical protein